MRTFGVFVVVGWAVQACKAEPQLCKDHACLAYYPLEKDAQDHSGNAAHGELIGDPQFIADSSDQFNAELYLRNDVKDGQYVKLPAKAWYAAKRSWTHSSWQKLPNKHALCYVETFWDGRLYAYTRNSLQSFVDNPYDNYPPGGSAKCTLTGVNINTLNNVWHNLVWVKDNNKILYYIDGQLASTEPLEVYAGPNPTQAILGGHRHGLYDGTSNNYLGSMAHVFMFEEAFSAEDVKGKLAKPPAKVTTTTITTSTVTATTTTTIDPLIAQVGALEALVHGNSTSALEQGLVTVVAEIEKVLELHPPDAAAAKIALLETEVETLTSANTALNATVQQMAVAAAIQTERHLQLEMLVNSIFEWRSSAAELQAVDPTAGSNLPAAPEIGTDGEELALRSSRVVFETSECSSTDMCDLARKVDALSKKFGQV